MKMTFLLGAVLGLSLSAHAQTPNTSASIRFFNLKEGQKIETQTRYVGDVTVVRIDGLEPSTAYTVKAMYTAGPKEFNSSIEARSDTHGSIETDQATPISGSYSKADPDGFFWSVVASKKKSQAPGKPGIHFSVEKSGTVVAKASLNIAMSRPGVRTVDLNGTGLVGTLYLPPAELGPRPAIITYSGSEGGLYTGIGTATALANQGFVGLGIAYFGAPGLPPELEKLPLEYFQKAIRYLQSRPEVAPGKIAVMGPSRGGELSLLLGATFPEIKAVVAQVPSPYRWGANVDGDTPSPAWILHGMGLPFLNISGELTPIGTLPNGKTLYSNRAAFTGGLAKADAATIEAATSTIEKTNGPILLLGADDDQVWPSCDLAKRALDRLKAKGHPYQDEMVCYEHAGHSATSVPGLSTMDNTMYHDHMQVWLTTGGTPEGNAAGQRASFIKTIQFLQSAFGLSSLSH